jgi:L,D-transpeptidase YcbB
MLWHRLSRTALPLAVTTAWLLVAPSVHATDLHFDDGQAAAAIAVLADAPSHGLDPSDYGLPALREVLAQAPALDQAAADQRDQRLSAALQRYLHDLHHGRAPPTTATPRPFDTAATLRAALAVQDLPLAVRQAAPALLQYQRLQDVLARYRQLASHPAWSADVDAVWRTMPRLLAPGQTWHGLPSLAARLVALGDVPLLSDEGDATLPTVGTHYTGDWVTAVQQFQRRHGLTGDGVIGRDTQAALQVTPAQRVRQIELALERLRWTPLLGAPRQLVVNIPESVLRAYEVHHGQVAVRVEMKVIVGKALDTRTPLIHAPMRRIEFKPSWNVPLSIARQELVPLLRRNPSTWAREGYELVDAQGHVDTALTMDKLTAVLSGALRIRQRPGPRNVLGDIKFVFPNQASIFLHHTASPQLFERERRDFSHGCIRVEDPVALAAFVLADQPGWSPERIRAAMAAAEPSTVTLTQALPVLIAYGTALVKEQQVHFFADLYGHDRALDAAMRQPQPWRTAL